MSEMEQAHHELERLQGIITRHEGHMFALRGWLLTVLGGLLAAYYTNNIVIPKVAMLFALPGVTLLFLFVETRHVNLVEAVVERATKLEHLIAEARQSGLPELGWYDGPQVSRACLAGATRVWPKAGMTFFLNRAFYVVVLLIVGFTTFALPPRQSPSPGQLSCVAESPP